MLWAISWRDEHPRRNEHTVTWGLPNCWLFDYDSSRWYVHLINTTFSVVFLTQENMLSTLMFFFRCLKPLANLGWFPSYLGASNLGWLGLYGATKLRIVKGANIFCKWKPRVFLCFFFCAVLLFSRMTAPNWIPFSGTFLECRASIH